MFSCKTTARPASNINRVRIFPIGRHLSVKGLRIICVIVSILFSLPIAASCQRTCYPSYQICINNAENEEIKLTLSAAMAVHDFFLSLGYSGQYPLEIVFQKEVLVETGDGDFIRVYGKLGKNNLICFTHFNEPWLAGQNAYGFKMSKAFYASLIVHEMAHFIAEKITRRKIEYTLSEYIAYVAQLSQMQPELRQAVLSRHTLSAFETEEISLEVMLISPAVFAGKSYLHFKKTNGTYLKAILSGTMPEFKELAYWHFH